MVGGWTCVVRFACHIPMGMVAFTGRGLYNSVKGLDDTGIYDVIPNGHTFLSGLQMYSTWGVFAFVWNFLMFIGCFGANDALLLVLALGDLLVAAPLLASVIKQAQFQPRTYAACSEAIHWRNGTDGRNFYLAAEWQNWEWYTAESFCKSTVRIWATTIAMVVLYLLMGTLNVAFFAMFEHSDRKERARWNDNSAPRKNIFVRFGTFAWQVIVYVTIPVLWVLDYPLAVFRLVVRYFSKTFGGWKRKWKHRKASKKGEKASKGGCMVEKELDIGEPPVLPFEVLRQIARDSHLADLVSASRASKALRAGLFGTGDVPAVLREVQPATCHGQEKEDCRLCGTQICRNCREQTPVAASLASRHNTTCRPYCTKCYFQTTCRGWARSNAWAAKHTSSCALSDSKQTATDVEMGVIPPGGLEIKMLCQLCAALPPEERRRRLDARDEVEEQRREREPVECGKCRVALPKGTMWWVCRGCFGECPSHLH